MGSNPITATKCEYGVMAAALVLETSGEIREGSTPSTRTNVAVV